MDTIVVGVDGSERAERAAHEAADLAKLADAKLVVVYAMGGHRQQFEIDGAGGEHWGFNSIDRAEAVLADLCSRLSARCEAKVREGKPADVLCEIADEMGADVIVVGNKRMQGAARVLGAVAKEVAAHAPCSVWIARTG